LVPPEGFVSEGLGLSEDRASI